MNNLKKIVLLICAPIILNFYFVSHCLSMIALTGSGEQVVAGSPVPGDGHGGVDRRDVNIHVAEEDSGPGALFQIPEGFSPEDYFQELLTDAALGKTQLEREHSRDLLERFLYAYRASKRIITSRADFHPIRTSGWCNRRTLIGPVRLAAEYAAETKDTELVALLLDYDFKWLETDGRFDQAHMLLPAERKYYEKLIHSDGYRRSARCCTRTRCFRAAACGLTTIALGCACLVGWTFGGVLKN